MKGLSFVEKTKELEAYTDRFETVTLFEISQLYGPSLCLFLIFLLSLPLLIFSTQWICLPLGFIIMALASLAFFDERLWLFDALKAQKISSKVLAIITKYLAIGLQKLQSLIPQASFYEQYEKVFATINPVILLIAAFQVGFVQSPHTSYFTVFTLLLISLGALIERPYLCLAGYLAFFIGLI